MFKIPVFLLHGPDESVPVAETLGAIQTLYKEGRFEKVFVTALSRLTSHSLKHS
jgi:aflatoxin B1 aldehyde reductase